MLLNVVTRVNQSLYNTGVVVIVWYCTPLNFASNFVLQYELCIRARGSRYYM